MYEFVNEFMYIHGVNCLAHVKCYSDCAYTVVYWWLKPVEMVLFMLCNAVAIEWFLL